MYITVSGLSQAAEAKLEVSKVSLTTVVFRRVKTPELQQEFTERPEAMMLLTKLHSTTATNAEQESHLGERAAAPLEGLEDQPWQQTTGQAGRTKNRAGVGSAGRLFRLSFPE